MVYMYTCVCVCVCKYTEGTINATKFSIASPLDNHKVLFFDQSQRTRLDSTLDHVHAVAKHSLDLQERSSMQDPAKVDLRTHTHTNKQTNKQRYTQTHRQTQTDRVPH